MIKNKKQASIVVKEIEELDRLIAEIEKITTEKEFDLNQKMQYDIYRGRIMELNSELEEFNFLTSQETKVIEFSSDDLQKAIVSFRIASGLTQNELAEILEIQEQQIQRYEQNDYLTASFERIIQILNALGVTVKLRKDLSQKNKISRFDKFKLPEACRNIIESKIRLVEDRNQILMVGTN